MLQYDGNSNTALNFCLKNHRNDIKRGVGSCELTQHSDNDVTVTIIEEIKQDEMVTEQKSEVLRTWEICWQSRLNALQPNGKSLPYNKRKCNIT